MVKNWLSALISGLHLMLEDDDDDQKMHKATKQIDPTKITSDTTIKMVDQLVKLGNTM